MLTFKVGPQVKSTARQRENTQAIRGVMFAEGTKVLCRDGLKWSRKGRARLFLLSLSFSLYLASLPPSSFPSPLPSFPPHSFRIACPGYIWGKSLEFVS